MGAEFKSRYEYNTDASSAPLLTLSGEDKNIGS